MIISRYLLREILKPQLVVCGLLLSIFVSYSSARYLNDAVTGLLPLETTLLLVCMKSLIALEVLLPITLFLSVMVAIGRLYSDSEMTALSACGVNPLKALGVVLTFSFLVAMVVGLLSLVVRPWAYEQSYRIQAQMETQVDLTGMEPGIFYEKQDGRVVMFVAGHEQGQAIRTDVFFNQIKKDRLRVIYAKRGFLQLDPVTGKNIPVLLDGREYHLTRGDGPDREATFQRMVIRLEEKERPPGYKRKAAPTVQLLQSQNPRDVAELQWRLSTPLSTVLLGLLGVPLSRTAPRQGKYAKIFVGVLIYAVYYNLQELARTWVKQGIVPAVPGIWWVNLLLICVIVGLIWKPYLGLSFKR